MEAVSLVNLFVPQGELIVSTRGKVAEQDRLYRTMAPPMDLEIPVVVLIDQSSASASEIVSGAIQDLDRGVVMGQLSYGKGLVQNTQEVGYNSRLKVTISKYYIPSGRCIQAVRYENGEPVALPDSLRQEFRTKNGRKVLDGGGVLPDLELEKDPPHPLVEQLKKEGWILRYVDDYCKNIDSLDGGQEFVYTRYDDFLQFLKKSKFRYSGPADRQIAQLKKAIEEEGFTKELKTAMKNLEDGLQAEQEKLYSDLRPVISRAINREIIERYYYNTGIIAFELGSDSEVQEAKSLLLDPKKYRSVLQVSRK